MSSRVSRDVLAPSGLGKPVPHREDARLLTGRGRYTADFSLPGRGFVLRSPHAHAKIVVIDAAAVTGMPGVLAVLTGSDAAADGIGAIPHSPVLANPHEVPLKSRDGSPFFIAPHPVLAVDAVRYVGEPVAIVVAKTLSEAMDAAERVHVGYEPIASERAGICGAARLAAAARICASIPKQATTTGPMRHSREPHTS